MAGLAANQTIVVRIVYRPLGVVSVGDMLKSRLGQLEIETAVLRDYLAAQRAARHLVVRGSMRWSDLGAQRAGPDAGSICLIKETSSTPG